MQISIKIYYNNSFCMVSHIRHQCNHQNSNPINNTVVWILRICSVKIMRFFILGTLKQGKSEGFDSCYRLTDLTQIGSKSSIFLSLWPRNLMNDLKKNNRTPLPCYIKLCVVFQSHWWIQTGLTVLKCPIRSKSGIFCPVWPWNSTDDLQKQ